MDDTAPKLRRLAAIDVGTNSIRLVVAEAERSGSYRVLDDEKVTTRLGRGLTGSGRLSDRAMDESAKAIARMKKIADGYQVDMLRAVATCAVREAENGPEFIDLVLREAGVGLLLISADEEARLAYQSVAAAFDIASMNAAVVDIGGGSTEIVLSTNGVVERVASLPLGAVRLTDIFGPCDAGDSRAFKQMRAHVRSVLQELAPIPDSSPQIMFGAGGTFTTAASIALQQAGGQSPSRTILPVRGFETDRGNLRHLLDRLRKMPLRDRPSVPGLSPDRADIIVAGLTIAECVMKALGVNRLRVHDRGIRDGLILSMIDEIFRAPKHSTRAPVAKSQAAAAFGAACRFEERHSRHVTRLSLAIFDQLVLALDAQNEPWASPLSRELLEAGALLHDVGYLIDYSKHHKHAYHLILHSGMPGFTHRELLVVANIARYHRRSVPKSSHENFARLEKSDREIVRRLTGILRIADGLDRAHSQAVHAARIELEDETVVFHVDAEDEPSVAMWGAERKAGLFSASFGLATRFAWNCRSDGQDDENHGHTAIADSLGRGVDAPGPKTLS